MCGTRTGPDVPAGESIDGVRYLNLGRTGKLDVHRFALLAGLMRRRRFDVVHAHMFGSNFWGTLFATAFRVPVILAHEHNWSYTGDRAHLWLDRWFIGRASTRFIAVSETNRERMIALEHVPESKIVVMPTAYIPHEEGADLDLRAMLGLPKDALLLGVAAHFRPEKALEVLIEATAIIVGRLPRAHLAIIGDGDCRADLDRKVSELQLGDHVHFLGHRRDVTSFLRDIDVGVMSSDWEGMPLFVLECAATHTPVVATAVGGLREIVDPGRTGMLVPPRDPGALADAVGALLTDPGARSRLAGAASEQLGGLTIEHVAQRFATLYEHLFAVAGDRRRARPTATEPA